MLPAVGLSRPAAILASVVFPEPDSPTRQVTDPASTWTLTLETATTSRSALRNRCVTSRISINFSVIGPPFRTLPGDVGHAVGLA